MSCMRSGFFSVAFCCLCLCRNLSMVWCGRDSDKWKWDLSLGSFTLCFRFPTRTLCVLLLKSQTEAHYSTTLGSRVLRTTSTGSTICTKTQTMIFTCVWLGRMNWKKCKQSSIRCKTKELRKFALPTILTLAINEKNKTYITAQVVGSLHIIAGDRLSALASKVDTSFPCSIGVGRAEHGCSLHTTALCFHIQLAGVTTFSESRSGNHTRDTVSGRGTAPSNVCLVESLDRSPHLPYCKIGR